MRTAVRHSARVLAVWAAAVVVAVFGLASGAGPASAASTLVSFARTSPATVSPGAAVTLSYVTSGDVASAVFHYTGPLAEDYPVTGSGPSGPASATVGATWPAGDYRLDYVDLFDSANARTTYIAGQSSLPFDGAGFSVNGTTAFAKPTIRGVLDRAGEPSSTWRPVVNGYVVRANWADLQPTQGGAIAASNAIDQAINVVRQQNAANRSSVPHLFLKLRVLAGDSAPQWAKTLDGGPVTVAGTQGGTVTIGKFWTPDFGSAYQDLMTKLAAKYDLVPEVRDVVVSRCTLSTAEPFLRTASDAQTRSNLVDAGFNTADDHTCHQQETDAHNVWARTSSSTAFTPYQQINPDKSRGGVDESWTEQMIDYCRSALGTRCVLGNNSIQDPTVPPQGTGYASMYAKINAVGPPIAYQTSSPNNGLGSLCNTLGWAVSQGTGAVELPQGYDAVPLPARFDRDQAFTTAGMSSYDKALEGAQPADTDTPTAPGNLAGTINSPTSVTLDWSAATDGGYGVACYKVSRGGTEVGTTMGTTFTYNGTGADSSTPYSVRAFDGAGHAGPAASVTVVDTEPPSAPSNLQATGASPTSIDLTWGAATDNFAVDHYTVYRGSTVVGTPTGTTFTDTGLSPSTSYNYTVTATDTSAHEGPGATATGSTLADSSPPTAPRSLTAKPATTSVALTWTGSTDNFGVTGYRVYRNNVVVGTPSGTTFTDPGLTPNTSYTYTVSAVDGAGNESARSNTVTTKTLADKTAPSTPTGVAVTGSTVTTASISWNASSDNVAVAGYRVYRNGSQVGTTDAATLSFTDHGLKPKTTYKYTVKAVDTSNNLSGSSASASVTTPADTVAPDVPTLTVTGKTATSVSLSWNKPPDNVGTTSFKVLRDGVVVNTTSGTTWTNSGLKTGTTYHFSVRAYDAAGNWSESDPVTATPS